MCSTCENVEAMLKMIQIRNVPTELHRTLESRAAVAGMSLSDYLLAELRRVAERPTRAELLEARLWTLDRRLAGAPGLRTEVRLLR